ncbi:unnamed protein product [Adineta steineri]|uniref:Uncharacterized protein n=1 Tax=Adineta steineri TaxID=433720 RepID=A0A815LWA9_9BILA|nr:unnamed protein product [Adineta steineri]CAF1619158.1 unnamed protein product [Adineta steineri]
MGVIMSTILYLIVRKLNNLSTSTIILSWIVGSGVTLVYLIWTDEILIIAAAYAVFIAIALFIGCQIKYYDQEKQSISPSVSQKSKYFQFIINYMLLLFLSSICGILLYYVLQLTKSHLYMSVLIGGVILGIIDSIGYLPQIILIIQMRSAVGFSSLTAVTEVIGFTAASISICLEHHIDIIPMASFIPVLIFNIILLALTLCIFPDTNKNGNRIQSDYELSQNSKESMTLLKDEMKSLKSNIDEQATTNINLVDDK